MNFNQQQSPAKPPVEVVNQADVAQKVDLTNFKQRYMEIQQKSNSG